MNEERKIQKPGGSYIFEIHMKTDREYEGFQRLATLILTGNLQGHKVYDRFGKEIEIRNIPIDISQYKPAG